MTSKHTPGPWRVTNRIQPDGAYDTLIQAGEKEVVAKLYARPRHVGQLQVDAELIAAAPELLSIMKELAFVVESVAHLQGREQELLPLADRARALQDRLEK